LTQGIYINGRRPSSKKEVKEAVADGMNVRIEATSMFGNEYDGSVSDMPDGMTVTFVGPDPYTNRRFYGNIKKVGDKVTVK
jgi:hypothetical protein